MTYETVRVERSAAVATITLDRPQALNALSLALGRDLASAVVDVDEDDAVRCVVLTGAGSAFCAGGDIREFHANASRIGAHVKELSASLHSAIARLAWTPKPVICAVNGAAAGGGFGLSVCGDIVIAAESARFTGAYARIGAAVDGAFTYLVPRLIGLRRAQELYFTDRALTAREAHEWGLVTRVVPDAELASAANALAAQLAAGPTRAFGLAKRLFHESYTSGLETQMERESQAISASALTDDWSAATMAFLEKRKPEFRGR
ncbi:MAG TPA: enoyl-CoA hydratase-related protein [Candidatus Limnocylindria bacterium]